MVEAALITPPVGMNVFIISGFIKHVPMTAIFRNAIPFVIAIMTIVALLIAFPQIALFLPKMMVK
jgi:TRAP-type C4-dicarboxylate transport system permease large subunit